MPFQTAMPPSDISILAGNSRVSRDEATGIITVQPQLAAFKAALLRAAEIRSTTNKLPSISIALDHRGTFRKQFLIDGLTNSQKRHPKLSQLRQEIIDVFQPAADDVGIELSAVAVIHEDSARTHASHIIQTAGLPTGLLRLMKANEDLDDDDADEDDSLDAGAGIPANCGVVGNRDVDRVTCAAVTSEYFSSSIDKHSRILEVFFENDIWSQANVYTRGAIVLQELGSKVQVRLRIVDKSGVVLGAKNQRQQITEDSDPADSAELRTNVKTATTALLSTK